MIMFGSFTGCLQRLCAAETSDWMRSWNIISTYTFYCNPQSISLSDICIAIQYTVLPELCI